MKNWLKEENSEKENHKINGSKWGSFIFFAVIFVTIVLPILMIVFNFGPSQKIETYQDYQNLGAENNPWSGY